MKVLGLKLGVNGVMALSLRTIELIVMKDPSLEAMRDLELKRGY